MLVSPLGFLMLRGFDVTCRLGREREVMKCLAGWRKGLVCVGRVGDVCSEKMGDFR
jgi:hypothetical protein